MFLLPAPPALAQAGAKASGPYPGRPVRIIVPLTAGGGVDLLARIVAQHYNAVWGQPFIVDNRPGAGGNIGYETVAQAQPDGYTLLVSANGILTNAAVRDTGYDPVRDFRAISKLTANPYILLTTPTFPVASVRDLIALAKAKPGQVTYGSAGIGSNPHLSAELFCFLAGVQMTHVPYKGLSEAYPAVASGTVNWVSGPRLPRCRSCGRAGSRASRSPGRLAAGRFPSCRRSPRAACPATRPPLFGLLAPARVPADIVDRLQAEARKVISSPEFARRLETDGVDAVANTPQEFAVEVAREYEKWRGLVKKAGIKLFIETPLTPMEVSPPPPSAGISSE